MTAQTALYSTPPVLIRCIQWRFAIDPFTGRGSYQWRKHCDQWLSLEAYPHRMHGMVTLAELDRIIYQPMSGIIGAAREACIAMRNDFGLTTQQLAANQMPLFH